MKQEIQGINLTGLALMLLEGQTCLALFRQSLFHVVELPSLIISLGLINDQRSYKNQCYPITPHRLLCQYLQA